MGDSVYVAQLNTGYKKRTTNRRVLKRAMGLSSFQPTYSFLVIGDAQRHDSEHVIGTGNGNHICTVTQLYIAIAIFC